MKNNITLLPLSLDDAEQFIADTQAAFKYAALEEFGRRDDHIDNEGEIISYNTIKKSLNAFKACSGVFLYVSLLLRSSVHTKSVTTTISISALSDFRNYTSLCQTAEIRGDRHSDTLGILYTIGKSALRGFPEQRTFGGCPLRHGGIRNAGICLFERRGNQSSDSKAGNGVY